MIYNPEQKDWHFFVADKLVKVGLAWLMPVPKEMNMLSEGGRGFSAS